MGQEVVGAAEIYRLAKALLTAQLRGEPIADLADLLSHKCEVGLSQPLEANLRNAICEAVLRATMLVAPNEGVAMGSTVQFVMTYADLDWLNGFLKEEGWMVGSLPGQSEIGGLVRERCLILSKPIADKIREAGRESRGMPCIELSITLRCEGKFGSALREEPE